MHKNFHAEKYGKVFTEPESRNLLRFSDHNRLWRRPPLAPGGCGQVFPLYCMLKLSSSVISPSSEVFVVVGHRKTFKFSFTSFSDHRRPARCKTKKTKIHNNWELRTETYSRRDYVYNCGVTFGLVSIGRLENPQYNSPTNESTPGMRTSWQKWRKPLLEFLESRKSVDKDGKSRNLLGL